MELRIYNEIVNGEEAEMMKLYDIDLGICYKDINEFCAAIPDDDDTIDLKIHCVGGSVMEGWAIYDRLRATGKTITATVEGMCASMATVILLAASIRKATPNARFLIHDPAISYLDGRLTADELQRKSEELRMEEEKILDLYVERTGANREALKALMKEERVIDAEEAMALGFIDEITAPLSASFNQNKIFMSEFSNEKKLSLFDKICALFSGTDETETEAEAQIEEEVKAEDAPEIKAQELTTADGGTLSVESDTTPKVGDAASPDGSHVMPDGSTIVVENGVITEIKPAEGETEAKEDEPNEIDALKSQVEQLIAQNAELTQKVQEMTSKADAAEENVKSIMEQVKNLSSTFKPAGRTQEKETEIKNDWFSRRMEEIKENNKKK